MDRRTTLWVGGGVAALVVAWALLGKQRREAAMSWTDIHQPPENLAAMLPTVSEAESWAAARCRPPACASPGYTAGMRIRKLYPATLAESPHSLIRGDINIEAG